jgi:Protein of unknown function (DUF3800)
MSLCAYFDESGHPGDPQVKAFAIGGCIASTEKWAAFEREWNEALSEERIPWFHMVDFEHPERDRDNQFFGWDQSRRQKLLNRLLDIMNAHIVCLGTAQRLPGSGRLTIEEYYSSHYRVCVTRPALFTDSEIVSFVFARHPTISGKKPAQIALGEYHDILVRAYSTRLRWDGRLGSMKIDDARKVPALQAADIVAYELGREQTRPTYERYPMRRLREKRTHFYDLNW